jgi:hypothetical protein
MPASEDTPDFVYRSLPKSLQSGEALNARRRLKSSLIIGFISSFGLHLACAVSVALFPYKDEPLTPKYIFIYLLLPGWAIAGREYHVKMWQESVAATINGVVYALVVFCILTWNAWRGGNARNPAVYWFVAIISFAALLWFIEALFLGFFPNLTWVGAIAALTWALLSAVYVFFRQPRPE